MGRFKPIEQLKQEQGGKLYGDQAERDMNTPAPRDKMEPKCPKILPREAKAAWRYMKQILQNWGLFNAANGPHLEMFSVNWAWYEHYRKKAWAFEAVRDPNEKKIKNNPHLGHMNQFEQKARYNLSDMGVGTLGLAKIGQALAKTAKKEGIAELID